MNSSGRVLQRLFYIGASALPSTRTITYSGQQRILHLRKPTIGALCGRSVVTSATMADSSEEQTQQQNKISPEESEPASAAEVVTSENNEVATKTDEEKEKNTEDGAEKSEIHVKADKKEGDASDPTKTTAERETGTDGKEKGVEMQNVEREGTTETENDETKTETVTEDEPKPSESDRERTKSPPSEENDPVNKHKDDAIKEQTSKPPAAARPPKQQQGGGLGSFFSSPVASMRRWFSQEPRRDREYYENLSLEEKRKLYTCGHDFTTLDKIPTWEEFRKKLQLKSEQSNHTHNPVLNEKVSLWRGDITRLEIDAIVNAANSSLLGGGGVDGAIHRAAGYSLKDECATLNGCETGDAKLTSGHRLPAKYVLHTVGPINGSEHKLRSCYERCLQLALENDIKSVAFCCIATGVYGYPNEDAAHVALETTRKWLENNADKVDRVIFCVFLKVDYRIYVNLLHHYFPPQPDTETENESMETVDEGTPPSTADDKQPQPASEDFVIVHQNDSQVVPSLERSITEPVQGVPSSDSKSEDGQQLQSHGTRPDSNPEADEKPQTEAAADEQPQTEACTTSANDNTGDPENMEVEGNSPKRPKND